VFTIISVGAFWHFIIKNRPENKDGESYLRRYLSSRGRAERKYTGNLGEEIKRSIRVRLLYMEVDDKEGETATTAENEPSIRIW
jgi:hypothetical protein